jgi:hypothetical protein
MAIEYIGFFIIKAVFVLFLITHITELYDMFFRFKTPAVRNFFIFIVVISIVSFLTYILKYDEMYITDMLQISVMRILSFIVIFIYMTYNNNFSKVLYMIWLAMIVSSIIAYNNDTFDEYTFRKSGGTEDPNDFAAQLLPTMFITYYLFKENKSWIFLLSSMSVFIYTLAYAGSKTSILSLSVLMTIILIVRFKDIIATLFTVKGLASLVLLLTITGVGAFYMSQSAAVKGMQDRAGKTGTMQQRFIIWRAGSEMIRDNFFLGVGFGQFPKVSKNYLKDYLAEEALPAHNNLVKIFAESGVFSFIAYMMFLFSLFFTKRREIFESDYLWIYLGSLATVLMSMTIPSLHHKDYWIFLSLVSYAIYQVYKEKDKSYIEANQV